MAANPTPTSDSVLLARLTDMARACAEHGEEIGLKINTGVVMAAALQATKEALVEVGKRKQARGERRKALREADVAAERTLGRCRLRLVMFYGQNFNVQWDAAGFPDHSTQVPESQAQRSALLSHLVGWFQSNPALESTDMQATATTCEAAHAAYQAAHTAVNRSKTELRVAVKTKDMAMRMLRDRFRSVIGELTVLLAADDARWRWFGLQVPAQLSTPRPVPAAQVEKLAAGDWRVTWQRGTHATRYRVQLQRPGETTFENLATVHGFEITLPPMDLLPGSVLQIIAANEAGEASPCLVVLSG